VLRSRGTPPVAADALRRTGSGSVVAGIPKTKSNRARRTESGFAPSGKPAYKGLLSSLKAQGVDPYRAYPEAELMSLRIPDDKLVSVLATLLKHPNVDYVEANQKRKVIFDNGGSMKRRSVFGLRKVASSFADPTGSNPTDLKHSFHNVTDAWDYTRGSGQKSASSTADLPTIRARTSTIRMEA